MSYKIDVDPPSLRQRATQLRGHADEYDSIRKQLLDQATNINSMYSTKDSQIYYARIEECCNRLNLIVTKLRNAADIFDSDATDYENAQDNAAQGASRLPG